MVQVIQLARGGYKTELRGTNTLNNLEVIETLGLLNKTAVEELTEAYIFLRNLEHRLMYLEDKQTQLLPFFWHNKKRIAASMNFTDYGSFKKALFSVQKKLISILELLSGEKILIVNRMIWFWNLVLVKTCLVMLALYYVH